ncbi:EamA family transporter [Carnimonas nigrificans]|uniref:EamA family transporter n=1 Tax=Carnimonas nigrificans TaxID=64323 RepID=UPI002480FFD3|nr:EamA family transporter [Carnimonas nigrificans]
MSIMKSRKATSIGLLAIFLWSSMVGLLREVSQSIGPVSGAAMVYTIASLLLIFTIGFPKLNSFPRRYLIWGTLLFVSYELCLCLSIGFASNNHQAIEVGMVNYLWPTLTIMAAIIFNGQRTTLLIIPGFITAMLGSV